MLPAQENHEMSDDQADAMTLASAFQAATDGDTRLVMNAMSNAQLPAGQSSSLLFYIVPASWFSKAYPILTARTPDNIADDWKEQIGRISNSELLNIVEREVSSDDDEDQGAAKSGVSVSQDQKKRFDLMHRRLDEDQQQSTMKPGLLHARDFFFLGPSAWSLVKEKFDFDGYELRRPVVFSAPNSTSSCTLSIQLQEEECEDSAARLIEVPASGRFPYEQVAIDGKLPKTSAIVPDDEGNGDTSSAPEDSKSDEESPVLLLPPSDTANNHREADNMDIDNSVDDDSPPVFAGRKRQASGLANLGNTCFMNSSIQCLAHTDPLRRYFLSGEYIRDLNKDNPLGTGGELATQFATLMGDMWGAATKRRSVLGASVAVSNSYTNSSSSGAIYPRSFKHCLGKHAEQFVGYDQHDSQEVATYLLDKLHEDTNRITKKPYVEIPEQSTDETDDVAADKAWKLHQKREDSRVLENFMGQIKSRLECCKEGCNRVSTTYDPFMFLSVPIPGSNDRKLDVTFVPLDPSQCMRSMTLTISKSALVSGFLVAMNEELLEKGVISEAIPLEDLAVADVWNHEIFGWLQQDSEVDRIRDSDKTFVYQLRPLAQVQEESKAMEIKEVNAEEVFGQAKRQRKYRLDIGTLARLNRENEWQRELENYVHSPMLLLSLFNTKRGSNEERIIFYKKLENFIDLCLKEIEEEESTGTKRARDGADNAINGDDPDMEEQLQGLIDRCDAVPSFKGVRSRHDVAILEFCANQMRVYILNMMKTKAVSYTSGVLVQVIMRRPKYGTNYEAFVQPLVLRLPAGMTVFAFRQYLARQISRSISKDRTKKADTGESSFENHAVPSQPVDFGSLEAMTLRQMPLTYEKKSGYGGRSSSAAGSRLGMLSRKDEVREDDMPSAAIAIPSDESESEFVAENVGPNGSIYVDWPQELLDQFFDLAEFGRQKPLVSPDTISSEEPEKVTSVMDCIEKYCQKEQLEETEMWYCNRCKDHVRAWKQFHIYRAPPILILHLKRFHYSASTHRRNKITSLIDFPLQGLDLSHLVSHVEEGQEPIYDLYAVSNHYGNLGGGHYTAYILGDDGMWLHYDDSVVSETTKIITEAAYVLYYRRRDVEVGQDPILQAQTPAFVIDQSNTPSVQIEDLPTNENSQAVGEDDIDDNMAVDGDGSSRTTPSPVSDFCSLDDENNELKEGGGTIAFDPESGLSNSDFPALQ